MKRPSFQFYPDDWSGNSNLKRCTHEEKGIWMDVLCVLHDQDEYGVVRWPLAELAQAAGTTKAKLKRLTEKGVLKGAEPGQQCEPLVYIPRSGRKNGAPVTLIEAQDGPLWFSSRMVTDEHVRGVRGGLSGDAKGPPDPSPKPPFGEGIDAASKGAPDPTPSTRAPGQAPRAAPSSPSPSPIKEKEGAAAASPPHAPVRESTPPLEPPGSGDVGSKTGMPADPIHARAVELVVLLRQRGASLQASDPRVREWAASGVTDAQALAALKVAQKRRHDTASAQAIGSGLLAAILADARASPNARASSSGSRSQKFDPSEYVNRDRISRHEAQEQSHDDDPDRTIDVTAVRVD